MVSEGQLVDLPRSKMLISWYFEDILTVGLGSLLTIIVTVTVTALLAMIALLAVQSSAQIFIHNAIFFIDTSNNV